MQLPNITQVPILLPLGFKGCGPADDSNEDNCTVQGNDCYCLHDDTNSTAIPSGFSSREDFSSDDLTPMTETSAINSSNMPKKRSHFFPLPRSMLPKPNFCDPELSTIDLVKQLLADHLASRSPRRVRLRSPSLGLRLDSIVQNTFEFPATSDERLDNPLAPQYHHQHAELVDLAVCAYIFCVGSGCLDKPQSISDSRFIMAYNLMLQFYQSCPSPSTILSIVISSLVLNDRVETLQPSVWDVYHPGKASISGSPLLSRLRSNTNDFCSFDTDKGSPKSGGMSLTNLLASESLLNGKSVDTSAVDKTRPFRATSFCYAMQQISKEGEKKTRVAYHDSAERLNSLKEVAALHNDQIPLSERSTIEGPSPFDSTFESPFHNVSHHHPLNNNNSDYDGEHESYQHYSSAASRSLTNGLSSSTLGDMEPLTPSSPFSGVHSSSRYGNPLTTFGGHDSRGWIGWGWTPEHNKASAQSSLLQGRDPNESIRGQRLRLGLSFSRQSFDFFWRVIPYFYLSYIYLEDRPQTTLVRLERQEDNPGIRSSFNPTISHSGADAQDEVMDYSNRTSRRNSFSDGTTPPFPIVVTPSIRTGRIRTVTSISGITSVHTSPHKERKVKIVENVLLRRLLTTLYSGVDVDVLGSSSYCWSHHRHLPPLSHPPTMTSTVPHVPPIQCQWCILTQLLPPDVSVAPPPPQDDCYSECYEFGDPYDWNSDGLGSAGPTVLNMSTVSHLNNISEDARRKYYRFDEFVSSCNRSVTSLFRALSFRLHIQPKEWSQRLFDILQECPDSIVNRAVHLIETLHSGE